MEQLYWQNIVWNSMALPRGINLFMIDRETSHISFFKTLTL